MRYASDHKAETRRQLLREASREIRRAGLNHVSVSGIMKRAGLTHGGFYSHFSSKNALICEAVDAAFAGSLDLTPDGEHAGHPGWLLRGYIDLYLSPSHRDAWEHGCPLPALLSEMARAAPAVRERFTAGVALVTQRLIGAVSALGLDEPEIHASSILSQMVGAVALARAVSGSVSDAILKNARTALIARYNLADAA